MSRGSWIRRGRPTIRGLLASLGVSVLALGSVGSSGSVLSAPTSGAFAAEEDGAVEEGATEEVREEEVAEKDAGELPSELPLSLTFAPESPLFTETAEELRLDVLLENTGEGAPISGALTVTMDNVRAESPADLLVEAERSGLTIYRAPFEQLDPGAERVVSITIPREEIPLDISRLPGVYPLRAVLTVDPADEEAGEEGIGEEQQIGDPEETEARGAQDPEQPVPEPEHVPGAEGNGGETAGTEASGGEAPAAEENTASVSEASMLEASIQDVSSIVWHGVDAEAPLPMTFVVPLVLPDSITTLPTRDQLVEVLPRLTELFEAAESHEATVAVDPRIVAAIRALGTRAPATGTALLQQLETTASPVFLLQYADADPSVQAALGFEVLLEPLGLSYATSHGMFAPPEPDQPGGSEHPLPDEAGQADEASSEEPGAREGGNQGEGDAGEHTPADAEDTPDAQDGEEEQEEEEEHVPTLAELLTLDGARPGAWPASGQVDSQTLSLLGHAGLTSVVLSSESVSGATGTRVTLGEFDALISDSPAAAAAAAGIAGTHAVDRAAGAAELAARTALFAQVNAPGTVVALDRGAVADSADPRRIFDIVDSLTWVRSVPEQLQPPGIAELRPNPPGEERTELLRETIARSEQIDALAPLLASPEYLLDYQRERLLHALASRYAAPDVDFAEVHTRISERDTELLLGVQPITVENAQLVGTSSEVPITLSNALPFDALVSLRATADSAAVSLSERRFEVLVPANAGSAVLVPVHSRVSSGTSGILLEVRDAAGEHTFSTGFQQLVLRTTIETILLGGLGSATALLLGFGIWRSIRRRKSTDSTAEPQQLPGSGE